MSETKIKVNELPSATPTLNDTLLGSNATKEYACKIEDLASLVGGGGSSGGGVMMITATDNSSSVTLNKTWQEIHDHIVGGGLAFVLNDTSSTDPEFRSISIVMYVFINDDPSYYAVTSYGFSGPDVEQVAYRCDSASDYPVSSVM